MLRFKNGIWLGNNSTLQSQIIAVPSMLGCYSPLLIPSSAWNIITMDFVEGRLKSLGKNCILVIVDKFCHFLIPLLLLVIYKFHGLPDSIISHRDKVFTSNFWQEPFNSSSLAKVSLCMSFSYHSQTDWRPEPEQVNQCLDT